MISFEKKVVKVHYETVIIDTAEKLLDAVVELNATESNRIVLFRRGDEVGTIQDIAIVDNSDVGLPNHHVAREPLSISGISNLPSDYLEAHFVQNYKLYFDVINKGLK